jgi:hypothetical protein
MEKTSIKDLYPDIDNFKVMDINTVRNMLDDRARSVKLNIHNDIKKEKRRAVLVNRGYDKIYDMCVEKINEASNFKKTDTVFKVPRGWKDYTNYSMIDCANHIVNKLKEEGILCTMLGEVLFITWDHLRNSPK